MVELTLEKALLIAISLTIATLLGIPLLIKSIHLLNELITAGIFLLKTI